MFTNTNYYTALVRILILALLILSSNQLSARQLSDSVPYLTRYRTDDTGSFRIPLTKYYFVRDAGFSSDWSNSWVMSSDIIKKKNFCLLILEMNATDVEGWLGNDNVAGSVQLVFELPDFRDSALIRDFSKKARRQHIINNYGGFSKEELVNGSMNVSCLNYKTYIKSGLNLVTKGPSTRQQLNLNAAFSSVTWDQYQELERIQDSLREARHNELVEGLTTFIKVRDSVWEAAEATDAAREDSLKLHPYTGPFRFWASHINKPGYQRTTYAITNDSLIIKEGPYDFIYLAKNYPADSVYFKKALSRNEKALLASVENRIGSDSLNNIYFNRCIIDGLQISFSFESSTFSKDVTVSNYYQVTIAHVVEFINKIAPKKYKLWYEKERLIKDLKACKPNL